MSVFNCHVVSWGFVHKRGSCERTIYDSSHLTKKQSLTTKHLVILSLSARVTAQKHLALNYFWCRWSFYSCLNREKSHKICCLFSGKGWSMLGKAKSNFRAWMIFCSHVCAWGRINGSTHWTICYRSLNSTQDASAPAPGKSQHHGEVNAHCIVCIQ